MINILVPVTFTDYSLNALTYALTLAGKFPSVVTILHSFSEYEDIEELEGDETLTVEEMDIRHREQNARDRLAELYQSTINKMNSLQDKNIGIQNRFEFGYPEDIIKAVCEETNPDVVVMGTKSKGETIKELLGSITSDVMKKVNVPVLAVPASSSIDLEELSKVLFITDFCENDYVPMHKLIRLISPFHTFIHAVKFVHHSPDKKESQKKEEFRDYCQSTYRNHQLEFYYQQSEQFVPALEEYVETNNIDLIAMTRRKRNMIAHLFSPEITRKILFHTDIPLLVFHP